MTATVRRRGTCRLCTSSDVEMVLHLEPTPIADDYVSPERRDVAQEAFPLDLFLCLQCGHVQLLDVVDPDVLFGNYVYTTSVSLGLVEHFRKYSEDVIGRVQPATGRLVVEIGSNDGSFLRNFAAHGLRVLGIDPAREIARRATESGIETLPTFFTSELATQIRQDYGPAAIIAANNVFAHSDSLGDMADGVRQLLNPDGVFVFEVSYVLDMLDKMLFDTIYHEHLCYHSVQPLVSFLRRHGLELVEVERIGTKGGSLRATAQLTGGHRAVAPSIQELLHLEQERGLSRPETFHAFDAKILERRRAVIDLVDELRARGKDVAGYGASPTVTTLLHHFHLGNRLAFLVDDNPLKQGTYSPGHHLPVLPADALYERSVDHVVVLAWNYADPIIRKHEAFRDRGGKFIVPLPEVQIV